MKKKMSLLHLIATTVVYSSLVQAKLSPECLKSVGFANGLISKNERESSQFVTDMTYLDSHLAPDMTPIEFSYGIAKIEGTSYWSLSALKLSLDAHPQVIKDLEQHGNPSVEGSFALNTKTWDAKFLNQIDSVKVVRNSKTGLKNIEFTSTDGTKKNFAPVMPLASGDTEVISLVTPGNRLVGLKSVTLPSGNGISKIELIFMNTNDVRCQPVAPNLSYNITAAFMELDEDRSGLLSDGEISTARSKIGMLMPKDTSYDLGAFQDYIVAEEISTGGSFDVEKFFPKNAQPSAGASGNEDGIGLTDMIIYIIMGVFAVIMIVVVSLLCCKLGAKNRQLRAEIIKRKKASVNKTNDKTGNEHEKTQIVDEKVQVYTPDDSSPQAESKDNMRRDNEKDRPKRSSRDKKYKRKTHEQTPEKSDKDSKQSRNSRPTQGAASTGWGSVESKRNSNINSVEGGTIPQTEGQPVDWGTGLMNSPKQNQSSHTPGGEQDSQSSSMAGRA